MPAIYPINTFDATEGGSIRFDWSGSQKSVHQLIYQGNSKILDRTVTTNLHSVDIPARSLSNGNSYVAYIRIIDAGDVESDIQPSGQPFMCVKRPSLAFSNLPSPDANGIITLGSSSYSFVLSYKSTTGEKLNSWSISVYSKDQVLLSSSGVKYGVTNSVSGSTVTATLSFSFSGFDDLSSYFVRGQGETLNGLSLDTGMIALTSVYSTGTVFALLEAENVPTDGKIHVKSNIVSATGEVYTLKNVKVDPAKAGLLVSGDYTNPETNTTKNGKYAIDLKNDYKMIYGDGFWFKEDYSLVLIMWNLKANQTVVKISPDATVYYRVGKFTENKEQACFELVVPNKINKNYTINDVYISNVIDKPASTTKLGLVIIRDGARYSINVTPGVSWTYVSAST